MKLDEMYFGGRLGAIEQAINCMAYPMPTIERLIHQIALDARREALDGIKTEIDNTFMCCGACKSDALAAIDKLRKS
jgi:hypothetical protein